MTIGNGKRIKWRETKDKGVWVTISLLYSKRYGCYYHLKMDENKLTFSVHNTMTGVKVFEFPEGVLTSRQNLRRHIRKKMKELGVELGIEMRDFREKKK